MPRPGKMADSRTRQQAGPLASSSSAGHDLPSAKRVSVLVGTRSVPLLPGRPLIDNSRSPWTGLVMEKHRLGAVAIPVHEHDTFCLHLQTSGPVEMDWHSSGRSGRVRSGAGNLIFLSPGTRDSMLWHGPSHRIVTSIQPTLLRQAAEQMELKGLYDFDNQWSFQDEQLQLLLTEMDREMAAGWPMGSLYGDLLGMSLSIALIRKYGHTSSALVPLKGGLSQPRLKHVLAYIEESLDRDIRLQELAELAGLSSFHFARSFRQSVGATPHQYIVQRRVQRAKELLLRPEWSIEQVASATGFAGASQFSRAFRQSAGVTPTEWRRKV
ncbi:helix-turn-helix domain-containing protein [Granulicella mallensis]|uniref:AraC family transcriptional regulator n=1 Tax=Granulicella mallensis TaxID=940614 RepID=A0A7W7ZTL7_9BACT|nr:AraC family transcriptional regulator [Granulicella mallensis]MBB5065888.1 AraC family transcriptional regulator [Granulicella mallensis]